MDHLIEVAFKGNRREFFRWSFEAPPPLKAAIIVDVERGEDFGRVHATGDLAERRRVGTTHGKEQREPLRAALRLASQDDMAKAEVLRADDETARRFAVQKARALNLQMKISDAEWQWDRRRLTFFFTAEERVDFRALVRQLETHFGVRVQMWHIGPRDEAKRLDGVGHCGRQLCSAAWLPELLPVKTSLAKEQRLSTITPTQISGAC
ncbi:MAG: regulatory iron-sulfur-containing complex subunit RicT, partial [Gemmatimonadaceae bacterium]|nr:regulatory iron-sulfur-containing complex subunit RicT [Gemmatimonadaceae bacterium]